MEPSPTVYETLASGSPLQMVPMIRNILGGFLFSGDDVYKPVRVLSGGERTRLAVARMLLRSSNTLLLDEPTNHLDLDSKEVLLDALVDYGGTLIFVSHDRYFVERLATKIIEIGRGDAVIYPGTYTEFLYRKEHPEGADGRDGRDRDRRERKSGTAGAPSDPPATRVHGARPPSRVDRLALEKQQSRQDRKKADGEARKRSRAAQARQARIESLEGRIAECEAAIRDIEAEMAAPGFYDDRADAQPVIDRHQSLMWQVGELIHQWEELQSLIDLAHEV